VKLKAARACAGKTQRCPACKATLAVPSADPVYDTDLLDVAPKVEVPSEDASPCETRGERTQDVREQEGHADSQEASSADEPKPPWPIDVILYPLRWISLIHLVALWLLLFYLCPFIMSLGLGTEYVPFVYTLPVAYAVYYFAECIRDRAEGGRHMPDYWMHPGELSRWDCVTQLFEVVGCVAMCFWPVAMYYVAREQADWIYWLLMAGGAFVFPMVLLAVVMFDSFSGLNPILIGGSILGTFVPYCGLVLLQCVISLLFVRMGFHVNGFYPLPTADFLLRLVQLYLIFVAIALLGTFYRRHEDRLDWAA
jgi:hypothetical protein